MGYYTIKNIFTKIGCVSAFHVVFSSYPVPTFCSLIQTLMPAVMAKYDLFAEKRECEKLPSSLRLKKALRLCVNKPLILVDKGPWYGEALTSLGLSSTHATRGLRNRVERWFRTLKERTRFYNNLNVRRLGLIPMKLFLNLFTY